MRIITILGSSEDFGFLLILKRFFKRCKVKTECIFPYLEEKEIQRIISRKKPDVLIIFSEESFPFFFKNMYLYADIFIPLKRIEGWGIPVKERSFVIVSSDDKKVFPFFLRKGVSLITCGMNSKASITVSSMDEDKGRIQCCVQRSIKSLSGKVFESQEFPIDKGTKETAKWVLMAAGVLISMGEDPINMTSKN